MSASLRAVAPGVRLNCETLEDRAVPAVAYALSGANLISFDTADTGTTTPTAVTGVTANEALVGIDFRAEDGLLYGLGVNATANKGTLYTISLTTGRATAVGAPGGVAFVDTVGNPVDLPAASVGYGVNFDPATDQLRVVTGNGLNFRVDPTGAPVDGNNGLPGSVNGTNPDGAINGLPTGSTGVTATAFTNSSDLPGGATTQYTLDAASNALFIQNANSGSQTSKVNVTLDSAPLDFTAVGGFDIPEGVKVSSSGAPATGTGTAVLTVNGATRLYEIDLATGAATDLGAVPSGVKALALRDVPATVAFTDATFTATEAGGSAAITFTRTGDTAGVATVAVLVTTADGSPFSGTSHVVSFAPGETSAVLNIPITNDGVAAPDQVLTLGLSTPSAGTVLGTQATATLTITDSGTAPVVPPAPVPAPVALVTPRAVAVGIGAGDGAVRVMNPDNSIRSTFLPYGEKMKAGVKVATGDVNGDGVNDVITAPAAGVSHVKVFDGATGAEIRSFLAFDAAFLGGVTIAAGDVNGDGKADIVVGTATGAGHVKVFSGADGSELASFLAHTGYTGGLTVATGDVNGDGKADIVTGTARGAAHVKVFDGTGTTLLKSYIAYTGFTGGVTVATGDVNGDGVADIVTGTATGTSHVKVFSGQSGETIRSVRVFAPAYFGGVNVGTADTNGDGIADVLVGAASGVSHAKVYDGATAKEINSFLAFGAGFTGGVFID